ncbi:HNH endonuclease [Xanthobacter sp. TB0139]|uniref:HNH endonuclease n=1 Tax=Xanthobacter sp. TB0139 TaxID=3459178 RepID=UPI004039CF5E
MWAMVKRPPRLRSLPPRLPPPAPLLPVQSHDNGSRTQRRAIESPWRRWYATARWSALREETFARDGYSCQMQGCGRLITDPRQRVCDHIRPHRGDEALFWDRDNLQTLCKPCHDGRKQAAERRRW